MNVGTPRMYADDTNATFSAGCRHDLESQINSDLKYIDRWLKANTLSLNVAKTEFMVISSRQKLQSLNDYTTNIHIDGVPINQSNQSLTQHMVLPNSLVRNFKNFKIVLSELSLNLAMILVPDFFSTPLVGTI